MNAQHMRTLGDMIRAILPNGWGFALFTFRYEQPGMAHYISSATRETMLKALRETYRRLSNGEDIATPEPN